MAEAEYRAQAALALAALAVVEHGVLGAEQVEVVQYLDDRQTRGGDFVPGGNRPAGEVVADDDLGLLALDHFAYVLAHVGVVAVAVVPAEAGEATGALLGIVPVVIRQAGTVDPYPVLQLHAQAGIRAGRQHGYLATAALQPLGQMAEDDFRTSADVRCVERIEK